MVMMELSSYVPSNRQLRDVCLQDVVGDLKWRRIRSACVAGVCCLPARLSEPKVTCCTPAQSTFGIYTVSHILDHSTNTTDPSTASCCDVSGVGRHMHLHMLQRQQCMGELADAEKKEVGMC